MSVFEIDVRRAGRAGLIWAQAQVKEHHYLHAQVDPRCRPFAYLVEVNGVKVGCLIFGRPEATRCYTGKLTYGSTQDVLNGRARFDRWEVLNLARVWLAPLIQKGGSHYIPKCASFVIRSALQWVGYDYLLAHPPVDCNYPYQIRCVMSYCDTRKHTGWIYLASRFKLALTNRKGIQTYMKPICGLSAEEDARIRSLAEMSARSKRIRMERRVMGQQLEIGL